MKETLKHQAYQLIKNNILSCVYAPGTIINEEQIREEIGGSRTPIRDALSRLEQERLVKILPKKGILITGITIQELNQLYETRELIETHVVKHYGGRIPTDTFIGYYRRYKEYRDGTQTAYSFLTMDENLHQLFINASENDYFISLYSTIQNQITRTRILTGRTSIERLQETTKEHLTIVEAAIQNNWNDAAAAMREHLLQSKQSYVSYMLQKNIAAANPTIE